MIDDAVQTNDTKSINNVIKHRAWDKRNQVMHDDFEFISSGSEGNDWIIFKSDKQTLKNGEVFDNPFFFQQFEIMACSHKTDMNGVHLCVGDRVVFFLTHEFQEDTIQSGTVMFDGDTFLIYAHDCEYVTNLLFHQVKDLKIISNIYVHEDDKLNVQQMMEKGLWNKRMDWCKQNNLPPANKEMWEMSLNGVVQNKSYTELLNGK